MLARVRKPKSPPPPPAPPPPRAFIPTRYAPRTLVAVRAWCVANPTGLLTVKTYDGDTFTSAAWLAWFSARLAAKINAADPRHPDTRRTAAGRLWRKTTDEYARALDRLRPLVGTRVVIDWVDPVLGERVKLALAARRRDPSDY